MSTSEVESVISSVSELRDCTVYGVEVRLFIIQKGPINPENHRKSPKFTIFCNFSLVIPIYKLCIKRLVQDLSEVLKIQNISLLKNLRHLSKIQIILNLAYFDLRNTVVGSERGKGIKASFGGVLNMWFDLLNVVQNKHILNLNNSVLRVTLKF